MKGRAARKAAESAARRWRQVRYTALDKQLRTPFMGTMILPIVTADDLLLLTKAQVSQQERLRCSTTKASIEIQLQTNHRELLDWWAVEHYPYFHVETAESATTGTSIPSYRRQRPHLNSHHFPSSVNEQATALSVACSSVKVHVGAPQPLGYPLSVEAEQRNLTEGVLRGEAHALQHYYDSSHGESSPRFPSPVRWLSQPLLDGFVCRRVEAHVGVTTEGMMDTRRMASHFGRHLPPHSTSPYVAADGLLTSWSLFGEAAQVIPREIQQQLCAALDATDPAEHLDRVVHLSLASALLPSHRGVWIKGAVVTSRRSGASVLILGKPRSGKTTLALHCLAASSEFAVAATDQFLIASGTPLAQSIASRGRTTAPTGSPAGRFLIVGIPGAARVGLGSVLGTLHPNPLLSAHIHPLGLCDTPGAMNTLLRNSEGILWDMSHKYRVHLGEAYNNPNCWQPAVLGAIAGIVCIDWDLEELHRNTPTPIRSTIHSIPLLHGGLQYLDKYGLSTPSQAWLKGHYLLRSIYDERDARNQLTHILKCEMEQTTNRTPHPHRDVAVYQLHGSVDFPQAVKKICELLSA